MNGINLPYQIIHQGKTLLKIIVYENGILLEGDFYKIYNREIVKSNTTSEFIDKSKFLGIGRLKLRSEKKLNHLLIIYIVITIIKIIVEIIIKIARKKANADNIISSLKELVISIIKGTLPIPNLEDTFSAFTIVVCVIQIILLIFVFRYILSKKDVYEISAVDKRLAFDKTKINDYQYNNLCMAINKMKEG